MFLGNIKVFYLHFFFLMTSASYLDSILNHTIAHTCMLQNITYFQEGSPVRLKSMHMVNMNYFIEKVMQVVKPFMNRELYNLVMYNYSVYVRFTNIYTI